MVTYPGCLGDSRSLCAPELWCPKNTLKFFIFKWYSTEVVINDFTMHLIIWKWLGRQNC